jgi:hypothetical protein
MRQLPPSFFQELKPKARDIALTICGVAKSDDENQEYREMRREFDAETSRTKRVLRTLEVLERDLTKLEADIEKSMRADAGAICDALREVHIPPNSPAVLPHIFEEFTLKNYLSVLKLPDPAELLENFFQLKTALLAFAREEKKTIQRRLESRKPPKRRVLATFSIPGARQYALKMLFSHYANESMPKNQIESRIAQILMTVDNGVLKIDPYRKDCAAVQKAIQRLADRDKERIDRRLRYLLTSRA